MIRLCGGATPVMGTERSKRWSLENVGETVSKPIWQEQKFPLEGDQWRPEVKKSGRDNLERKKLCSG